MKKTISLLALFGVIIVMTACQPPAEVTISKYFQAMQANDNETLAAMAIAPKDIEFKSYKIISTSEPEVVALELPGLVQKLEELKKARQDQVNVAMDKRDQLDELQFQMEETRRRAMQQELEKKIETLKNEMSAEEQKVKDIQAQINKLNQEIKVEKAMITMSTGVAENFEMYQGETSKMKSIVKITLSNGEVKDYVFLLRKNKLTLDGKPHQLSRLVITIIAAVEDFDKAQQQKEEENTATEEVSEQQPATAEGGQ